MISIYSQLQGAARLIQAIATAQLEHYRSLANFNIYGKGWTNRVNAMETLAISLV
jgi:lysozyme family protein